MGRSQPGPRASIKGVGHTAPENQMNTYPKIGRDTTRLGTWTVSYLGRTRYFFRKREALFAAERALTVAGYWNPKAVA